MHGDRQKRHPNRIHSRESRRDQSRNKLIVVCGFSFAGKSTLGRAICEEFGIREVDVDKTMLELYGDTVNDEALSNEQWDRIYAETDQKILGYLRTGNSVVDASRNFRKAERSGAGSIAKSAGADLVVVYVNTRSH